MTGKVVNLKKAPCLKDYHLCPIYRKTVEEKREEAKAAAKVVEARLRKKEPERVKEEVIHEVDEGNKLPKEEVKEEKVEEVAEAPPGVECGKCLYYSSLTGLCIKMMKKVEDPKKPPCGGKYFKQSSS
ncbi:hypothetical protein IPA_07765 [Ignicoccus pacificus DSM 13166]|uniref:Uncharacterized protein n=1 Tax=Ignicoccus pacificus DSM 13166 TaxID=940294 RepID=A0A977KBT7_9CREN|nr:hypothetical protein IPA_07765 [Ignicoccus pacificus DSM 13166]